MKSREEYEASIYKKRDALLAKRKKNIRMTVTALSVIICLSAAVFAMPKLMDKADKTQLPSVTNAASGKGAAENEDGTYPASFDAFQTQSSHKTSDYAEYWNDYAHNTYDAAFDNNGASEKNIKEDEMIEHLTMSEIYRMPETEIALETEIAAEEPDAAADGSDKQFAFEPSGGIIDIESIKPSSSSKKTYTTEEITAAAESCLSASDAENIISDKTNAVVSRKSDGTTTYTVYFYTAEKKITVKLSDSLKLIEITEKNNAGGTAQIAPAYNPDA